MDYKKLQKSLAPLLRPLSSGYSGIMNLRAEAYSAGLKKSASPKAFCVSVGNIAWGGSGKTPLADWLLAWARERGLTSALLTRGYGGKSEKRPLLVKPGTSPDESGDEPLMLARRHPEAYILADPKRRRALEWLEANSATSFSVLDDAMQHLAVRRNLDLVLLRAKDLSDEHWNKVIPAGVWREGVNALSRASAFLLRMNAEEFAACARLVENRLAGFEKPVFSFELEPIGLKAPGKSEMLPDLGGRPYTLCTGVGNPESVTASASALLGQAPGESFIFPDHHRFDAKDLRRLAKPGLPVVMTAKDAVKIQPLALNETGFEYYVLESRVAFGPRLFSRRDFPAWLEEKQQASA